MTASKERIVGEMVVEDYHAAAVFKKYGIDFCCNGNRTIADACEQGSIDAESVIEELNALVKASANGTIQYDSWPLDLLADYVEKKHHRYVDEAILQIKPYLEKICQVHGNRHPELYEVQKEFLESAGELTAHMKKEEFLVFPLIRKMVKGQSIDKSHFGSVQNPIQMMMEEHDTEGERFRKISDLTSNYTPPADGCNTYKVTFSLLKEFEEDLQLHIHLENNILFPKAIKMEKNFQQSDAVGEAVPE